MCTPSVTPRRHHVDYGYTRNRADSRWPAQPAGQIATATAAAASAAYRPAHSHQGRSQGRRPGRARRAPRPPPPPAKSEAGFRARPRRAPGRPSSSDRVMSAAARTVTARSCPSRARPGSRPQRRGGTAAPPRPAARTSRRPGTSSAVPVVARDDRVLEAGGSYPPRCAAAWPRGARAAAGTSRRTRSRGPRAGPAAASAKSGPRSR